MFANLSDLLGRDVEIAQFCRSGAAGRGRSDRANTENGPGCADHTIETGRENLFAVAVDFAKHVLDDPPLVPLRERIAFHEPFREPYRSNLEAACELQGGRGPQRNLNAAATDVDNHGASAAHIDAIHGRLMDEARLLGT